MFMFTFRQIVLGNTSAENKGPECTIAYNNIESSFSNHVFYINFVIEHLQKFSRRLKGKKNRSNREL